MNAQGNSVNLPGIADWAINPKNKITYTMVGGNAVATATRRTLYSIDFKTGVLTKIGNQVESSDILFYNQPFGSMFFDSSGVFLVFGNITVDLYKIDMENQIATKYTSISSPTNNNDGASCALASILPVELVEFSGQQIQQNIELKWSTASEFQNLGFEVQHSKDGLHWEFVDFITSQAMNGNSSAFLNYNFIHHRPDDGIHYYRLKQIDFDGTIDYSKILNVEFKLGKKYALYPNPVNEYFNIIESKPTDYIIISNSLGAMVKRIYQGNNNVFIGDLSSGLYHITLYSQQHEILESFLISKNKVFVSQRDNQNPPFCVIL